MRVTLILGLVALMVQRSIAPPVQQKKHKPDEQVPESKTGDKSLELEYGRYLQEVAQVLETDPVFSEKLLNAKEDDIRTGEVAHHLQFVTHSIRTKLDELKRQELERLRHLVTREYVLENGLDPAHLKIAEHIDHMNPHTFEIDDLKKLIIKTTNDLDELDAKRKEEFKEFEMESKFQQEQKMKTMNDEEKKKYEEDLQAKEKKHKEHEKLHHPGSKQQLEEVWEKEDHMEGQEFDPKTFFYLHDIDGNGYLDTIEVKALFRKELDKLYEHNALEEDIRERDEEMERMREHVFKEIDLDRDGLISYYEFQQDVKSPQFREDTGWETLHDKEIYSQQEYEAFKRNKEQEIEKLVAQGVLPPSQQDSHVAGSPQQVPPQQPNTPISQGQAGNLATNQIPQNQHQFQGQPVVQQYYPAQPPPVQTYVPQLQYQGNVPQQHQQFQPQVPQPNQQLQPPQQLNPPGQVPQVQLQQPVQNQVPQQQFQGQVPQYQQPIQNQVPVQQPVPVQQAVPVQQPVPVQQLVPVQQAVPIQQPVPVQQAVPVQQPVPVQQAVPVQQPVPVQQAVPVQQPVPVQQAVPVQQPVPVVAQAAQNSIPNVVKT